MEWCLRVAKNNLKHIVVAGNNILHETSSTRKEMINKINFLPMLESSYNLPKRDAHLLTKLFCYYKHQIANSD